MRSFRLGSVAYFFLVSLLILLTVLFAAPRSEAASAYIQQAKLFQSDGANDDRFGTAIAISGDTAVVGTVYDDFGTSIDQGSAYVFVRSGGTWTFQAKLSASDGASSDRFGWRVAISGETILVGAYGKASG